MDILSIVLIVILVLITIAWLINLVFGLMKFFKAIKERNDTWKELSPEEKAKYNEFKKLKGS